ncbi:hypothetical protein CCACVL1_02956 [Corchorus capsularis]|uniref:Uncharacterized protein n=1 Tax=Corchorus capsularis TaxID=210143 RepID=A0A1R3K4G8_COCAP|nr:hypothetical protein CCACVL1_02956 [Corchorus capsularis]
MNPVSSTPVSLTVVRALVELTGQDRPKTCKMSSPTSLTAFTPLLFFSRAVNATSPKGSALNDPSISAHL